MSRRSIRVSNKFEGLNKRFKAQWDIVRKLIKD